MKPHRSTAPLARSEQLLVESVGEELVLYDVDKDEAHCLNPLAATVFAACDGSNDTALLAQLAADRLQRPVSPEDVDNVLAQLDEKALLTVAAPRREGGMSRRGFVRRAALVGAAAVPVVASVAAPRNAWAVASCLSAGASCTGDSQCCTAQGLLCRNSGCQSTGTRTCRTGC
jgi:hypothetical protein